jgi:hypothetical protein
MGTHDEGDDESQLAGGPALRPDGQITGRTKAVEPPPPLAFGDVSLTGDEAKLELVERPPKPVEPRVEVFRPEPPAPRRRLGITIALAALALAAILFGLAVTVPRQYLSRVGLEGLLPDGWTLGELTRTAGGVPLIIESIPTGATITVGDKTIGVTPWAGDNVWPDGAAVTLSLPGYAPWTGVVHAGAEQRLSARLKPLGKVAVDVELGAPQTVGQERP